MGRLAVDYREGKHSKGLFRPLADLVVECERVQPADVDGRSF